MARRFPQKTLDSAWTECFRDPMQGWKNCKSKVKCNITKFSLWIHGSSSSSSWLDVQLDFAELLHGNAKYIHNNYPLLPEAAHFVALLRSCAKNKDLRRGISMHNALKNQGFIEECSDALITMYAKCGELAEAEELLDLHKSTDVFSWTDIIAGYVQRGQSHEALQCFERMQRAGLSPDAVTFTCILKACGSIKAIQQGEQVHEEIARQGLLGSNLVLGNALVDMYAKCGALLKAQHVLEELPMRDVVTWSTLIAGYAQEGQGKEALNCFQQMQREGISPDAVTYACILKACGSIRAIDVGAQIHGEIARQGLLKKDILLGDALVDMYAKHGAFGKAKELLEELPFRSVVSWSALIAGYVQHGQGAQALDCYRQMQHNGCLPNVVTYLCILKACGIVGSLEVGKKIHDEINMQGVLGHDSVLGTALVDMYAKCGALGKAKQVLEGLPSQGVVTWNALMTGYIQKGEFEQVLTCFEWMQGKGLSPTAATYLCILKAYGVLGAADKGEQIHAEIARLGLLENDVRLGNALVDMYAKCGALKQAEQVLDELADRDIVSWNSLIAGYAAQGHGEQALDCFERMHNEGQPPDEVTFSCILQACGMMRAIDKGELIHTEISRQGLLANNTYIGTALVDMYAKCSAFTKAEQVLKELPAQTAGSWTALISGYLEQGLAEQAK